MSENEDQQITPSEQQDSAPNEAHSIATGLGAIGGGAIGSALGKSINQNIGTTVGGVVGAIVGGIAGNAVAGSTEAVIEQIQPSGLGFGADDKPVVLPKHYTWNELQALSKPSQHDRNVNL